MKLNVKDAFDLHVHVGPELFERIGNAEEVAGRANESGMAGIALKCHHESTVTRASEAQPRVGDIRLIGGIVLNEYVGGINPQAVQACLSLGGKIVWMPTMHSAYHSEVFGKGTYGLASMTAPPEAAHQHSDDHSEQGLFVLDRSGRLTDDARTIVDLTAEAGAIVATSHLSPNEIDVLADYCRDRVKLIITHPLFMPRGVPADFYKSLTERGAVLEMCGVSCMPIAQMQGSEMDLIGARDLIEHVGIANCILSTDAGQPFNPWPDEALRVWAQLLHEAGLKERDLRQMMIDNPAALLGL